MAAALPLAEALRGFLLAQLPTYWLTPDEIDSRAWSPEALVGTRVMIRCERARRKMERSP
jgi:hypothetical protein